MSDETMGSGTDEIGALLADRQRIQDWLDRLERSTGSAPEGVRRRVRADYEARLAEVVAQLSGYTAALSESLAAVQAAQADLEGRRAAVEEALAEAELRHAVGEFTDEQWDAIAREHGEQLDAFSGEIGRLAEEASRLADVLGQVAPEAPEPVPAEAAEPEPARETSSGAVRAPGDDLDIEVIEVEEVSLTSHARVGEDDLPVYDAPEAASEPVRQVPVEAPRFTPKPGMEPRPRERPAPRTLRFPAPPAPEPPAAAPVDEMTFLKSVTLDSGAPVRERGGEGRGIRTTRGAATGAKTLKCTECGAMNRPTEWYCERCGAELAAV